MFKTVIQRRAAESGEDSILFAASWTAAATAPHRGASEGRFTIFIGDLYKAERMDFFNKV